MDGRILLSGDADRAIIPNGFELYYLRDEPLGGFYTTCAFLNSSSSTLRSSIRRDTLLFNSWVPPHGLLSLSWPPLWAPSSRTEKSRATSIRSAWSYCGRSRLPFWLLFSSGRS